jgi:hypothetical protein
LSFLFKSLDKGGKLIIETNFVSDDPEMLNFRSKTQKAGQVYELTYKTIKYNKKTRITKSQELIEIKEKGKTIEKLETVLVQRWWKQEELQSLLKKAGFSKIEIYGGNFRPSKKPKDRLVLVAIK